MVDTIGAVVHGHSKKRSLAVIGLHFLGAAITAALLGAGLGALGALLGAPWGGTGLAVIALVAVVYLARESFGAPVPIPEWRRQVPSWWRDFFTPPTAAFLFGAGLGVGFLTFLTFGTFVAVATAALVGGDPSLGAVLCAPFGIARATAVALASLDETRQRSVSLGEGRVPAALNVAALAAVPLSALAAMA